MKKSGFAFINQSSLYRKVAVNDLIQQDPSLVIDLGPTLNAELAALANPGYVIVMYDNRVVGHDGYPVPHSVDKSVAHEQGPDCFPTQFLRDIAGRCGNSYGHAHIGPDGLGWNSSTKGSRMSGEEIRLVTLFHARKVHKQIRHYPLPVTRNNIWKGDQYRIKPQLVTGNLWDLQNWELDNWYASAPIYY